MELADALPGLRSLRLGSPCWANRCRTTALSLFTLSTRCPKLRHLEIYFNTTRIGHDLDRLFKEPQYQTMRSLPRYPLRNLTVGNIPISSHDLEPTVVQLSGIFHGLQGFRGRGRWIEASRKARSLYVSRIYPASDTRIREYSMTSWCFIPSPGVGK